MKKLFVVVGIVSLIALFAGCATVAALEEPVGKTPADCIEEVFDAVWDIDFDVANMPDSPATVAKYKAFIKAVRAIDISECPDDFQSAFVEGVNILEEYSILLEKIVNGELKITHSERERRNKDLETRFAVAKQKIELSAKKYGAILPK